MSRIRVLILGGTAESFELADALAKDPCHDPTLSLAGVTRAPRLPSIRWRSGGFGGVAGLVRYVKNESVDLLVGATHPFAAQMRRHIIEAARITRCPLLLIERPAWIEQPGDRWVRVPDISGAAAALGAVPRRVLLTVGRKELVAFAAQPQHTYLIRTIEPPAREHLPPDVELIMERGPFALAGERELLVRHRIELVVTKNSGGPATQAKLAAARDLGATVIMVERPPMPPLADAGAHLAHTVAEALEYLKVRHQELLPTHRRV